MKYYYLFAVLLCVAFSSCDGRKSHKESLEESVTEFKDSIGPIENIKYFPEEYAETVTDTILSNGYRVKLKTYTDMENSVLNEFKVDTIVHKHYYREFIASIYIEKEGVEISNLNIDKDFIIKNDESSDFYKSFYEDALLYSVWLSEYNSTISDKIIFIISLCKPESDDCIMYETIIHYDGKVELNELEEYY
ncbi:hypothetical protein EVU94_14420 [Flavobacteriaceae bacterium 144Ye]|uniref:hypothetical protein n=1 Tax=Gaetbulibacter jejuensis TaxID=584607 RepID=UPI00101CAF31|nr:hypothetical protein EVU94_14420 [Flavobacteriaceae bacterium 144Ye]